MTYTLKDVDDVEAAFRRIRPEATLERSDFDFGLTVFDGNTEWVLFKPSDQVGPERTCSVEAAEHLAFFLGDQWTPDQIAKMQALIKTWPPNISPIFRVGRYFQ